MISTRALEWSGIMSVASTPTPSSKRPKSLTEAEAPAFHKQRTPSKRLRSLTEAETTGVPATPVNEKSRSQTTPSCSTRPMSKEPKSTRPLQAPALKVEDCRYWSACFTEAIVAEDVLDNLDLYLGFTTMPDDFVEAATKKRLRSLWQSMCAPIPSPRDDRRGIIFNGKNRQHVFDVAPVLMLAVQLSDTHTNSKMRERLIIIQRLKYNA